MFQISTLTVFDEKIGQVGHAGSLARDQQLSIVFNIIKPVGELWFILNSVTVFYAIMNLCSVCQSDYNFNKSAYTHDPDHELVITKNEIKIT